jgi:hypothetical protein
VRVRVRVRVRVPCACALCVCPVRVPCACALCVCPVCVPCACALSVCPVRVRVPFACVFWLLLPPFKRRTFAWWFTVACPRPLRATPSKWVVQVRWHKDLL